MFPNTWWWSVANIFRLAAFWVFHKLGWAHVPSVGRRSSADDLPCVCSLRHMCRAKESFCPRLLQGTELSVVRVQMHYRFRNASNTHGKPLSSLGLQASQLERELRSVPCCLLFYLWKSRCRSHQALPWFSLTFIHTKAGGSSSATKTLRWQVVVAIFL